jgi:hypothetical protein
MVRMAMFSFDHSRPLGYLRAARAMTTPEDEASDVSDLAAPREWVVGTAPGGFLALPGCSLPTRPDFASRRKR